MKSKTTLKFRRAFAALPNQVRKQARKSYHQFKNDPWHPNLRFKQIHTSLPIFSARIGRGYRSLGLKTENEVVWFWIGSHSDYDKLIDNY